MPELSYREAVRDALSRAMREDENVFVMGEDIAEMGGSMGVTHGMLAEFGPERIRNTPISEIAIVGAGIGAAIQGLLPVVGVVPAQQTEPERRGAAPRGHGQRPLGGQPVRGVRGLHPAHVAREPHGLERSRVGRAAWVGGSLGRGREVGAPARARRSRRRTSSVCGSRLARVATSRQISQVTQSRVPPPQAISPVDDNRTHSLTGSVALSLPGDWRQGTTLGRILRDVDAFMTFRVQSGLPYTRLKNSGGGTLSGLTASVSYTAGEPTGWLTATLNTTTAPSTLTLSAATGSLAAGTYTASVAVASPVASNSPQTVSVTFTLSSGPQISLSTSSLAFDAVHGGATPSFQTVGITNSGTGTLSGLNVGTITYGSSGSGWLRAPQLNLTTASELTSLLVQTQSLDLLRPGTYTATVPVQSAVASYSPQNVTVTLNITAGVQCSPDGAPSIAVGETLDGSLSDTDCTLPTGPHADVYLLTLLAETDVQIDLTTTAFTSRLRLRDPATGVILALGYTGFQNARLTRRLSPGTYVIEGSANSASGAGSYQLAVTTTALPIPFDGNWRGTASDGNTVSFIVQLNRVIFFFVDVGRLEDVDEEALRSLVGDDAARDLTALREIERLLEEAGAVQRHQGRLELTPRGVRALGERALLQIYDRALDGGVGSHGTPRGGGEGEPTGTTRRWRFGDPFRLDVSETVRNAVVRGGVTGSGRAGGPAVRLEPDDFALAESERRVRAATVLLLDMSFSMPLRGNWTHAKRMALALQSLVASKFPEDTFYVVGFSDYARRLRPADLLGGQLHRSDLPPGRRPRQGIAVRDGIFGVR